MKASATKERATQRSTSRLAHHASCTHAARRTRATGPTRSYLKTRVRASRLYEAAFILVLIELNRRLHQAYQQAYDKHAADRLLPQKSGVEFLPNPIGSSYGDKNRDQIKSIIDSLLQNERCRRAFEIVGLQTINQTVEKGVVIGPASLLSNPANNSTLGIVEGARRAYNNEFGSSSARAATIGILPGQPNPFSSRRDQRTRMFFSTYAFSGDQSSLRDDIVHEFIHAGGQPPISSLVGDDLYNYDWRDFLLESCR
ncbi:MAG: hypothetical protein ACREBG_02345 [Pyrinomonadaceae bacterium]